MQAEKGRIRSALKKVPYNFSEDKDCASRNLTKNWGEY